MNRINWYNKKVYLLLALALVLSSGLLLAPQTAASPDEATFYSRSSDGYMFAEDESYSIAQGDPSGTVQPSFMFLGVGQLLTSGEGPPKENGFGQDEVFYSVFRGALFFDTSSLPDDATITSATLSLYGYADTSDTDFDIAVVDGSVLGEPLESADYGDLRSQTVSGGVFNTAGFSTSGYNDIPLNETGMGWISKMGITKFGLRSSRDIASTAPTASELVDIWTSEKGAAYQPRLVVTYTMVPVGGQAHPVNKLTILAPWMALCVAVIAGVSILLRRRRAQS
jgi:hypothetical protein